MPSLASVKWDEFVADADDLRERLVVANGAGGPNPSALGRAGVVALVTAWEVYIKTLALEVVSLGVGDETGALGERRDVERLVEPHRGTQTPKFSDTRDLLLTALYDAEERAEGCDDPMDGLDQNDLDEAVQRRHDIVHLRWDEQGRPDTRRVEVAQEELADYIRRLKAFVRSLEGGLSQLLETKLPFAPWLVEAGETPREVDRHDH